MRTVLLLYNTIVHIVAILVFCRGFLLTRVVLEDKTPRTLGTLVKPTFTKAVILVIDALRFDFTVPVEHDDVAWANKLRILHRISSEQPQNAFLTRFIAHPPTTTLQRLKGLTTGSLPTFVDAGSNFGGEAILEDNILAQLKGANRTVAFVGDDTWQALFPGVFDPENNFPFESLNVWDLDTVDNGVYHHLVAKDKSFLKLQEHDIIIAHALGLDHSGHRYGPDHLETTRKLLQMDAWVADLIDLVDDDTLLVVMGDHGMNAQGDHGGDSYDELNAALFMYTKRPFFDALAESQRLGVSQIDLVPTLSLLLGIPIPFNNLGSPIPQAFIQNPVLTYDKALGMTTESLDTYIKAYSHVASIPIDIENNDHKTYHRQVLNVFEKQWAQYDIPSIALGCIIMASGIITSLLLYQNPIPRLSTHIFTSINTASIFSSYFLLHSSFLYICMLAGLLSLIFTVVFHRGYQVNSNSSFSSGAVVLIVHALVFASNSFTIHEDRIALLLVNSTASILLVHNFGQRKYASMLWLVEVMLGSRLASTIGQCREEQLNCVSSFKLETVTLAMFLAIATSITLAVLYDTLKQAFNMTIHSIAFITGFAVNLTLAATYWIADTVGADMYIKFWISRSILFSTCIQTLSWWYTPLPVTFTFKKGFAHQWRRQYQGSIFFTTCAPHTQSISIPRARCRITQSTHPSSTALVDHHHATGNVIHLGRPAGRIGTPAFLYYWSSNGHTFHSMGL
ncbi:hypothetical protein MRB53_039775 [Persea americana]|nr:hypothetical protein MRB53_039775 [Persea americana]